VGVSKNVFQPHLSHTEPSKIKLAQHKVVVNTQTANISNSSHCSCCNLAKFQPTIQLGSIHAVIDINSIFTH